MIKYLNNPNKFICLSTDDRTSIEQDGNIVYCYDTGREYIFLTDTWYAYDNTI